jgi:hypothetical protein
VIGIIFAGRLQHQPRHGSTEKVADNAADVVIWLSEGAMLAAR